MTRNGRHASPRPAKAPRIIATASAVALTLAALALTAFGREEPANEPTSSAGAAAASPTPSATSETPSAPVASPTPSSSPTVPADGPGTFETAGGDGAVAGDGTVLKYRVEVEDGLTEPLERFVEEVDKTLASPRGWAKQGYAFQRSSLATTRILLASPGTTDRLCAPLKTNGEVSCRNGDLVVVNAKRWALGAPSYDSDLVNYRTYLINHEVGHRLGFGHKKCPAPDQPAPVMSQQTKGLDGCTTNPWP